MFLDLTGEVLVDKKIGGTSKMYMVSIGDYLARVSMENNPFQRKKLSINKYYKKLVMDLLDDTVIPPISILFSGKYENLNNENEEKFMIMDGLQRTNCLFHCVDILSKGNSDRKIKTLEEFRAKKIYIEVWTGLDLNSMLYKMVVLNTGQKKMDYSHQLEILNFSLYKKLESEDVKVSKANVKSTNDNFNLSTVVNGLVSFINGIPISSKKDAAEFLFENINTSFEAESTTDELGVVADESTYKTLIWVLKDLNNLVEIKYGEENPFKKYDVFLISFLASLGDVKRKYPEKCEKKIELLKEKLSSEEDPLNLKKFTVYYNKFKSGIGDKRRKFIYEAFRSYFKIDHVEDIEWDETYETIFGR